MSTGSPSVVESSVPLAHNCGDPPDGPIERRTLVRLVRVMSVDREQTNVEDAVA